MTKQTARAEDEAASSAEASASGAEPNPAAEIPSVKAPSEPDPVAVAIELRDKLLRTLADMENLRKRTDREVADARTYGVTSFARDMLAVADNMRRALDTITPEVRASVAADAKGLIDGIELTERELLNALEKNRIRQFTPQGEKFDPNLHQAMFEIPDVSVPAGSVVQVVQPGYMIGERMLRPALVGVSKGGPRTAPASAPNNDNKASAQES